MFEGQRLEPILLQVVIQVHMEHLKHNTDVSTMCETLVSENKVELFRTVFL